MARALAYEPGKGTASTKALGAGSHGSQWIKIWPIALLTCAYLVFPPEVRFSAGGLNFPLYRLLIIILLPVTILRLATGRLKPNFVDLCVLITSSWMVISFVEYYGPESGFVRSVALVVDLAGSYVLTRVSINSPNDARRLLVVIAPFFLLAGVELLLESVTHKLLVRPFYSGIFGNLSAYNGGEAVGALTLRQDLRLGLLRAFGPFSHPILGGVVLTSMLAVYWSSGLRSWPKAVGILAAILGLFSLSSSVFLATILAIALLLGDKLKKAVPGMSWWTISGFIFLVLIFLQVASKNGVVPVLIRMTLDPQTGFYRLIIWEYGWQSVMNHPLIGIGFTAYERPDWLSTSIDAHFLLLGVRHGLVAPVALFLGAVTVLVKMGLNMGNQVQADRHLMFGMNICLVIMLVTSMTVTFFGEANIWFMTVMGLATSLSAYDRTKSVR